MNISLTEYICKNGSKQHKKLQSQKRTLIQIKRLNYDMPESIYIVLAHRTARIKGVCIKQLFSMH